ncbi:MAG TPA: hypothetical protein VK692_02665 [Chthoniobacterales bacterium]|nr:hypothetical protein [Chthoniobacterales bacterium]
MTLNGVDDTIGGMISLQFDKTQPLNGYRGVALRAEDRDAPIAICLLVRTDSSESPPFILLRETLDASIYLGSIVDRSGHPKAWVEVWVQNVDRVAFSFRAQLEPLTNSVLDQRWADRAAMFRTLKRATIIETGAEFNHPVPALIDGKEGTVIHPSDPGTRRPFVLCQDEKALELAGLPSYGSSLHRYLWNGSGADESVFLAITSGAPMPPGVRPATDFFQGLCPFNPGGGLLLVRPLAPLALTEFADILSGKTWPGFQCGKETIRLGAAYAGLEDAEEILYRGGHLFSGRAGRAGRLLEVFHLKLNLILQALDETRSAIRFQQLPFLVLGAESFRVQLSEIGTGLPLFWSAQVDLAESTCAAAISVGASGVRYFIPPELSGPSIYRPQTRDLPERGSAMVRIRKIFPPTPDGTSLEATLATDERLNVAASDLIHVRLPIASGRTDLYGRVDESEALAKGETRFRTIPQILSEPIQNSLEQLAGAPIGNASFEILPLLTSPCDMYALGVLAVKILLVDDENTLAIALDEMLSLARQIAVEYQPGVAIGKRLQSIVERDGRWETSLGPHRLVRDDGIRQTAARVVPADLWWETIGVVTRLFPGIGPDSFCGDLGDAPSSALEQIFDEVIGQIDLLLLRSRSLVVADWNQNLEIHDAIYEVIAKKHGKRE